MSDSELLKIRVRVQRAMSSLSKPRTERTESEVTAALMEVEQALARLAVR